MQIIGALPKWKRPFFVHRQNINFRFALDRANFSVNEYFRSVGAAGAINFLAGYQNMTVKISHLAAQGLPEKLLNAWQRRFGGDTLLPLQQEVVARTGLLRGESLLLIASTSAGKTFVAEMAAALHLEKRRRVIYLVPTKALAEEKFHAFHSQFAPMGWRVFCAIQERPESDRPVLSGAYDLVVAVYEKLKGFMVQHPEFLHNVGAVVVDEMQNLGDPTRGATLEFIMAKLAAAPYRPQLIGLSAVLGNADEVAAAVGCRVWPFQGRPVELREGVFDLADNTYYYKSTETGQRGQERLGLDGRRWNDEPDEWYREGALGLAGWLAREAGEQVIVFVPSRGLSRRWARQLAEEALAPPARRTLEMVIGTEESYSRSLLGECLEAGVAFHNADLPFALRAAIEEGYNSGEIRVLVSTSTLAQGVNLMSRNVIQIPAMVEQDEWSGRPVYGMLSRQIFRNQGGRAGRLGHAPGYGRSIIVAAGSEERERLIREYIDTPLEPVPPMLAKCERLDKFLLDMVATGMMATPEKMKDFFLDAYSGQKVWVKETGTLDRMVREGLGRLEQGAMITRPMQDWWAAEDLGRPISVNHDVTHDTLTPQSAFLATGLGEAAAAAGIMPETARIFGMWLSEFQPKENLPDDKTNRRLPTSLEVFLLAALTPDARQAPITMSFPERQKARYWQEARGCLVNDLDIRPKAFLRRAMDKPGGATEQDELAAKKALLLDTWITDLPTLKIESKYETLAGSIHNISVYFLWLVQSLARAGESLGASQPLTQWLGRLAERLYYGLPDEGVAWSRLRHPALHRHHILALLRNGWTRPADARESSIEDLTPIVGKHCALALTASLNPRAAIEDLDIDRPAPSSPIQPIPSPPLPSFEEAPEITSLEVIALTLDASHPGEATVAGQRVYLPPLPWRMLWALMREPGQIVAYERLMAFVWEGAVVEQQQISFHTRNLRRALAPLLGNRLARDLITPRPGQGLVLNVAASQVHLTE